MDIDRVVVTVPSTTPKVISVPVESDIDSIRIGMTVGNLGLVNPESSVLVGPAGPDGDPGSDGLPGDDGQSAYALAVSLGYVGTQAQWIESLHGTDGADGTPGEQGMPGTDGVDGINGTNGTNGTDGVDGVDGKSAYELAVDNGFVGTESAWLLSLKGDQGEPGVDGDDGLDGSTPTIAMSGDQVTVNGVVTGPHLTGPIGSTGPTTLFISNGVPTTSEPKYLWIQTGLGAGSDITFWVEDGQ